MHKLITIFTPTFNRSILLARLYKSLILQTNKNFKWVIVDDGSSDGTKKVVDTWKEENLIEIEYYFKKNGGMHTAHNVAYKLISTELNFCIDSDDYLPHNSIEKIINFWNNNKGKKLAGIIALNANKKNKIIGKNMPKNIKSCTLGELYNKYKNGGDKKLIYRTDIMKKIQTYPEYKYEKLVPLSFKYILVDKYFKMLLFNEVVCHVDYQSNGSSNTIIKQYFESPKGFIAAKKNIMLNSPFIIEKLKACVMYVFFSIIDKDPLFLTKSPLKALTLIFSPCGIIIYFLVSLKKL